MTVSVLIENPSLQHPLVEGPFVHDSFGLLFVQDSDESDESDEGDLTIDRDVAIDANASIVVGIENNIVAEYVVYLGRSGCQFGSKNE